MATLRRRLIAAGKFALGLGLMALVLRWLAPDLSAVLDRVRLDPALLVVGFLCTLAASVVTSGRWKLMVEAMGGTRLPYPVYFHALVLTRVLGQFTSTLAMDLVGRGLALRSAGSERGLGHAMTQAILERIFDLLLPGVLLLWAIVARAVDPSPLAAAVSYVGLCLVFAALAALILWPLARLGLASYRALARWRGRPAPSGSDGDAPVSRRVAALVGSLSAARYLLVLGQFWAIAAAIGVALDFRTIASATPLGQLAGIIGVTPGALGIQEAGWAGAFKWLNALDAPTIGLFVLGQRALVLANFALLSLLSYPWARRAGRRAEPAVIEAVQSAVPEDMSEGSSGSPPAPERSMSPTPPPRFPDTPRGRHAARLGGRCPVHGCALETGPGWASTMDLLPSHAFEAMQLENPFCLDLGESFTQARATRAATLIWCRECVAATRREG